MGSSPIGTSFYILKFNFLKWIVSRCGHCVRLKNGRNRFNPDTIHLSIYYDNGMIKLLWEHIMNKWLIRNDLKNAGKVYRKQTDRILEQYQDQFNLSEIEDEQHRKAVAVLIENQILVKEYSGDIDLNLVKEVYGKLRVPQWVNFYALLGPSTEYPVPCKAKSRKFRTHQQSYSNQSDLAQALRLEIEKEVFDDLRQNAGTVATLEYNEEYWEDKYTNAINSLFGYIKNKSGFVVETIVIPSWMKKYCNINFNRSVKIHFIDLLLADVLLLAKGNTEMGYYYNPYIPLMKTPEIKTPDFCPIPGFLARYGKHITKDGHKLFATLQIRNLPKE